MSDAREELARLVSYAMVGGLPSKPKLVDYAAADGILAAGYSKRTPASDTPEHLARDLEPLAWAALGLADTVAHAKRREASLRTAERLVAAGWSKRTPGGEAGLTEPALMNEAHDRFGHSEDARLGFVQGAEWAAALSTRPAGESAGVAKADKAGWASYARAICESEGYNWVALVATPMRTSRAGSGLAKLVKPSPPAPPSRLRAKVEVMSRAQLETLQRHVAEIMGPRVEPQRVL